MTFPQLATLTGWIDTVVSTFEQELGRRPESSALAAWLVAFSAGATGEQLRANLIASEEYAAKHPPTPPAPAMPTRAQVRKVRGLFSVGTGWFDHWSAVVSDAECASLCASHTARGDTHCLLGMNSGGYRQLPAFSLWDRPQVAVDRAKTLWAHGLIPTWVLHDDDAIAAPAGQRAVVYERHWRQVADVIRPYVWIVVPAYEWNDHLTPMEQDHLLHVLAELFPDAYRLVTFTDDRWSGGHAARSEDPDGPLPAAWKDSEYHCWRSWQGIVHGLAFQAPKERIDSAEGNHRMLRERLAEIVIRLNGTRQPAFPDVEKDFDGKYGGVGAGDFDLVYWEGPAEWIFAGSRTVEWGDAAGRDALTVPGVAGCGDGWK
jgi:hypothetical protein